MNGARPTNNKTKKCRKPQTTAEKPKVQMVQKAGKARRFTSNRAIDRAWTSKQGGWWGVGEELLCENKYLQSTKNATKSAQKLNTRHAEIWLRLVWATMQHCTTAPPNARPSGARLAQCRDACAGRNSTWARLSPPSNGCTFRSANWPAKRRLAR